MLQSIRDRTQGWLTWFIVILICTSFALWGIHSYLQSGDTTQIIAEVNGYEITKRQHQATYERLRQQLQAQQGSDFIFSPAIENSLKQQALTQLIKAKALSDAAFNSGYRVSQQQLSAMVAQIPAFQNEGQFSVEKFHEILARTGYTENAFFQALQADILIGQVQSGFIATAFGLPNEVAQVRALLNQKRDISYLTIPVTKFKTQSTVTQQQLEEYYHNHQAEFMVPEQVSINYIELGLDKLAEAQAISESQVKQYYQENIKQFAKPVRYHLAHIFIELPANKASDEQITKIQTKLAKITNELKSNLNFSELTKTYSDDVITARKGGDLGWVHLTDLDPEVSKATAKLTNQNSISQPIRVKNGYEIIKLIAIEPVVTASYQEVKDSIKKRLAQQKAHELYTNLSDKLANLTFSSPDSLAPAAKELALPIHQTGLFSRAGGKEPLTTNPKIIAAAFARDSLEGNNSDLIEIAPGHIIVLRINEHKPATTKPFNEVKATIEAKLQELHMRSAAKQLGETIVKEIAAGKSAENIGKNYNLAWRDIANLTRHSETVEPALIKASFSMTPPSNAAKPTVQGFELASGDYVVIALQKVTNAELQKLSAQEKEAFANEMALSYADVAYQLYVDYIMKQAKIKLHTDKLTQEA